MLDCRGHYTAALNRQLHEDGFPLTDRSASLWTDSGWCAFSFASPGFSYFRATSLHSSLWIFPESKANLSQVRQFIKDFLLDLQRACSTQLWACFNHKLSYGRPSKWWSPGITKQDQKQLFHCFQDPMLATRQSPQEIDKHIQFNKIEQAPTNPFTATETAFINTHIAPLP